MWYVFRCHHQCEGAHEKDFRGDLKEAQKFGLEHYKKTGHVGVIWQIKPISLTLIPGSPIGNNMG